MNKEKFYKKEVVPNTLVIYMKTNIPNFQKLTYKPDMTILNDKDPSIQFNPLVKLYKPVVNNISNIKSDPTLLYSQFFNKNQFETLINNTLSNFRYMQPKRTLLEATQEGIVDNNIQLTIDTLFKDGNILYLNKKPYTILGKKWVLGDWQLEKSPIPILRNNLYSYSYSTNTKNEMAHNENEMAQKELEQIPEELRQGSLYSANLNNQELKSRINEELNKRNVGNNSNNSSNNELLKDNSLQQPKPKLEKYPENYQKLLGDYLTENDWLNTTNATNLTQDPLTLTILYNNELLEKILNETKEEKFINVFSRFDEAKKSLLLQKEHFEESFSTLSISKEDYNSKSGDLYVTLTGTNNFPTIEKETNDLIKSKIAFLTQLLECSSNLITFFQMQENYFTSMVEFIEILKEKYKTSIDYYKDPQLAWECFDFDLKTYRAFLNKNDNVAASYFKDNTFFTNSYRWIVNSHLLDNIKRFKLNEETQKYINNPELLKIENVQYDIYSFQVLLYMKLNEVNIWNVKHYFTSELSNKLLETSKLYLGNTSILNKEYNSKYNKQEQETFIKENDIVGFEFGKQNVWYTINSKHKRAIKEKRIPGIFIKKKDNKEVEQEKLYIKLKLSIVECYDYIVLTTFILQKECGQSMNLLVGENNVSNIREKISNLYLTYYEFIHDAINNNNTKGTKINVPLSWMWDVTEDYQNSSFIQNKIKSSFSMKHLYIGQINSTELKIDEIIKKCNSIYDSIYPNIGETSFMEQCNNLLSKNIDLLTNANASATATNQKMNILNSQDYDIQNSQLLNSYIEDFIFRSIQENYPDLDNVSFQENWMVYDNIGKGDCFFASVKDLFNAQMELMNYTTTNKYTEEINDKRVFTVSSLRKAVSDNFTRDMYDNYLHFITLNGTIISPDDLDTPELQSIYNLLVENGNGHGKIRSFDHVKQIIETPCSTTQNAQYWADQICINILEEVFKIKFIIFDVTRLPENNNVFKLGDEVKYKQEKDGPDDNYRVFQVYDDKENKILIKGKNKKEKIMDDDKMKIKSSNLNNYFRILCYSNENILENPGYLFLLKNNSHYEAVYKSDIQKYVLTFEEVPLYIKYLIYDNCYRFLQNEETKKNTVFIKNPKFKSLFDELDKNPNVNNVNNIDINDNATILGGANARYPYYYPYQNHSLQKMKNINTNKYMEKKSNLAYFITMDIDLYPGESISTYEKAKGRCYTQFEKIRRSWSEIFGYEYRPAAMNIINEETKKDLNKSNTEKMQTMKKIQTMKKMQTMKK